jgi:hypothetical protein
MSSGRKARLLAYWSAVAGDRSVMPYRPHRLEPNYPGGRRKVLVPDGRNDEPR